MDIESFKTLVTKGLNELSIEPDEKHIENLYIYFTELKKWNKQINLTAIRDDEEIILRLLLPSFCLYPYLKDKQSFIDVGSGSGIPAIPLKIFLPHLKLTLIESRDKKTNFIKHIIRTLKLKDTIALNKRAEEADVLKEHSGKYDVATCTAFASLELILKLESPFLKKDGIIVSIKGAETEELISEIASVEQNIAKKEKIFLPVSNKENHLIILNPAF